MILSQFTSCGLSLIVLVCWLGVNDAIPFGPNPGGKVRPTASRQSKVWNSTEKAGSVTDQVESITETKKLNNRRFNSNYNSNINVNINGFHNGIITPAQKHSKFHQDEPIKNVILNNSLDDRVKKLNSSSDDFNDSVVKSKMKKIKEDAAMKDQELPEKCMNETNGNLPYRRSFPGNMSTIDVAGAFNVMGEAEAKKTSSVHIGEDITLCWIETTTIKEDPAFDPPKRLVIREFTISFENAATIPINYLECSKFDGEIRLGDEETVCKSSLHEVIDANTKRSRVANFTSVSHVGPIIVHKQKTVRCAMGGVVSKDIYEWPDGSDNPKKRVEIKVGPSIRNVGIGTDQKTGQCTSGSAFTDSDEDRSSSSASACNSDESCGTSMTCEDGEECNGPSTTSPACEDGECATESLPEQTESTTYLPDMSELSSTEVAKPTTTEKPDESVTETSDKSDKSGEDPCQEDDIDCKLGQTTVGPVIGTENASSCSVEDCSEQSSDGSTTDIPSEENYDTFSLCSGESCSSGEEPETDEIEAITVANSESCQDGSESCSCSRSSCSIDNSEESISPSSHESNKTILNDSECDSEAGDCSGSPETLSEEGEITTISSSGEDDSKIDASTIKYQDVESTTDQGKTELPDRESPTEVSGSNDVSLVTEVVRPCDGSKSRECTTLVPGYTEISDETSREMEAYSSNTEKTEISVATMKDELDADFSESVSSDEDGSFSCEEDSDDESCQSIESSSQSESVDDNTATDSSPERIDTNEIIFPTTEDAEKVPKPTDDTVTSIPTTIIDSETAMIDTSTLLPDGPTKNETKTSDEDSSSSTDSVTVCSTDSEEGSGDCMEVTITSSTSGPTKPVDSHVSTLVETTLSPESCGSSESCESKEILSSITETNQPTVVNYTENAENSEEPSCEGSDESCETSSSGTSSEICEDGSSNGDCAIDTSISNDCDLSSNSCSSETNSSIGLTDETSTTTTESTAKELEHFSTTIDNVSTTAETRRSTAPTLSLISAPNKGRHKLALRIKVLLERINENKEREKLVQVEKHLLLNERPEEHGNHSLIWKIKSLNNSMNLDTFKSILNYTALENFTEEFSHMTEFKDKREERVFLLKNVEDHSGKESTIEAKDESGDDSMEESYESSSRRKREISVPKGNGEEEKNMTDLTKVKAIRESLPGVDEDFKKGMDHVLYRISQELDGPVADAVNKPAQSSPSKLLKILADPTDRRVHSRRRKRVSNMGGEVSVEELEHPVNGEEIGRWSNERFFSAADGGRVRSLLEFKILKDPDEDSRRIPSGS